MKLHTTIELIKKESLTLADFLMAAVTNLAIVSIVQKMVVQKDAYFDERVPVRTEYEGNHPDTVIYIPTYNKNAMQKYTTNLSDTLPYFVFVLFSSLCSCFYGGG